MVLTNRQIGVLFGAYKRGELKITAEQIKEIYSYSTDGYMYPCDFVNQYGYEITCILNAIEAFFAGNKEEMQNQIDRLFRYLKIKSQPRDDE